MAKVSTKENIGTVAPTESTLLPLELLTNDGHEPLQPANDQSAKILARFHCEIEY